MDVLDLTSVTYKNLTGDTMEADYYEDWPTFILIQPDATRVNTFLLIKPT